MGMCVLKECFPKIQGHIPLGKITVTEWLRGCFGILYKPLQSESQPVLSVTVQPPNGISFRCIKRNRQYIDFATYCGVVGLRSSSEQVTAIDLSFPAITWDVWIQERQIKKASGIYKESCVAQITAEHNRSPKLSGRKQRRENARYARIEE